MFQNNVVGAFLLSSNHCNNYMRSPSSKIFCKLYFYFLMLLCSLFSSGIFARISYAYGCLFVLALKSQVLINYSVTPPETNGNVGNTFYEACLKNVL